MTKKLYYTAPDVDVWTTTVTSVRQDGETYIVTLAETAFYPEGGGQPSDAGTIAGLPVLDVFDENGEVYHRLPAHPGMGAVSCVLDRKRRRDHTQQHSGQHLLSAVLVEQLGAETVGFHLGREVVTVDITAGALTEADMLAVENRANELIYANLPVETYWVTPEEAERMPFRKRPDVQGSVRVVEMKGIDLSACCGTHVKRTGEIGVIKLLKAERHRGMTRLSFLCGGRALADYQQTHRVVQAAAGRFGTSRDQLLDVIAKWEQEKKEWEKRMGKTAAPIRGNRLCRRSRTGRRRIRTCSDWPLRPIWGKRTANDRPSDRRPLWQNRASRLHLRLARRDRQSTVFLAPCRELAERTSRPVWRQRGRQRAAGASCFSVP